MSREVGSAVLAGRTVACLHHGIVPARLFVGGQGEITFEADVPHELDVLMIDAGAAATAMLCQVDVTLSNDEQDVLSLYASTSVAGRRQERQLAEAIIGTHFEALQTVQALLIRKGLIKHDTLLEESERPHIGLWAFRDTLLRPSGVPAITPRLRAAIHEAGHAIGFAAGGVAATNLWVKDDGSGFCGVPKNIEPVADILGSIVGHLAPRVCAGDLSLPINDEDRKSVEQAIFLAWEKDPTRARDSKGWRAAEKEAREFLRTHRDSVLALAKQLEVAGEMTGEQIRKFIPEQFRECSYSSAVYR